MKHLIYRILRLALPMAGARFVNMFTTFIGLLMVAHLGPHALSVSALISGSQTVLVVIYIAVFFAVGVVVGEAYGAKSHDTVGAIFQQSILLSVILSIPLAICSWFTPAVLVVLGQPEMLVSKVVPYFHMMAYFAFPLLLQTVLQQIAYGVLQQRVVILSNLVMMLPFFAYAYFLMFGLGSFHGVGIAGLALASGIQNLSVVFLLLMYFRFSKTLQPYALFSRHSFSGFSHLKKIWGLGLPMSIQYGCEIISMFARVIFVGWLGAYALSAFQVVQQVLYLMAVPIFAMSEAAGVLVSQHIGAKEWARVGRTGNTCVYLVFFTCFIVVLTITIFSREFASLYMSSPLSAANIKALHYIPLLFLLTCFSFPMAMLNDMYSGVLRGLFDTKFPMWNSILNSWLVNIPLAYLLCFTLNWGLYGIYAANLVSMVLSAYCVFLRWRWQLTTRLPHFYQSFQLDDADQSAGKAM